MRKMIAIGFFLFVTGALTAQTTITKEKILGKWTLYSVETIGVFYYNIDKDSIVLGKILKDQATTKEIEKNMIEGMKQKTKLFKTSFFRFNSDGTAELFNGMAGVADRKGDTYIVDEKNSTITTVSLEGKIEEKTTMQADMLGNNLRLKVNESHSGNNMIMILKKVKS